MQKLHVYGHPRLPIIGTIFKSGAFRSVGSMNFQRSRTPGSSAGSLVTRSMMPTRSRRAIGRTEVVVHDRVFAGERLSAEFTPGRRSVSRSLLLGSDSPDFPFLPQSGGRDDPMRGMLPRRARGLQ